MIVITWFPIINWTGVLIFHFPFSYIYRERERSPFLLSKAQKEVFSRELYLISHLKDNAQQKNWRNQKTIINILMCISFPIPRYDICSSLSSFLTLLSELLFFFRWFFHIKTCFLAHFNFGGHHWLSLDMSVLLFFLTFTMRGRAV